MMITISGTPLEIALWFVAPGGSPPPAPNPLNSSTGEVTLLGLGLVGQIQDPQQQAQAIAALRTPFDQLFDTSWDNLLASGTPQYMVQQAVRKARPSAYNIVATFPAAGTLQADVGPVSTASALPFPPAVLPTGWKGRLLTLQYSLQGSVQITWSQTTGGVVGWLTGSLFDASYQATFDGTLIVYVAVPADPAVGLIVQSSFQATHVHAGLDGFSLANAVEFGSIVLQTGWDWLTFQTPPSNSIPDQNIGVTNSGIEQAFGLLSGQLAGAVPEGFTELSVQVNGQPQPNWTAVNRVEFDLVHPFDAGPVVTAGPPYPTFGSGAPQISASPGTVVAGTQFTVLGTNFPAMRIVIGWTDTASGEVSQSEVQWGRVLPTLIGHPLDVDVLGDVTITRYAAGDGRNTFTATNLAPDTNYAFRVRDYDLQNQSVTGWGDWTVLKTPVTNQVQLILGDPASTGLGTFTLQQDGTLSALVTMPAGEAAGIYPLWATISGAKVASTTVTVIAQGQQAPPQLEVIDPTTGLSIPPVASVIYQVSLRGDYFEPGPVTLAADSQAGPDLGTATADAHGSFSATFGWLDVGPHTILGVQNGQVAASVPVYGLAVPQ
jgi:hypothetical protein